MFIMTRGIVQCLIQKIESWLTLSKMLYHHGWVETSYDCEGKNQFWYDNFT